MPGSRHALQVPARRDADQQLMVNLPVDLEFRMTLEVLSHSSPGVVARTPGAVGKHLGGHVVDHGVEYHAVTAHRGERSVGLKFGQNVVVSVVAIKAHQYPPPARRLGLDLVDNLGCDAGALNHDDALEHGRSEEHTS